jgi:hypothetical protein
MEFFVFELPGSKIPWNFCSRNFQDEKFHGISVSGTSGMKNTSGLQRKHDVFYKMTNVRYMADVSGMSIIIIQRKTVF